MIAPKPHHQIAWRGLQGLSKNPTANQNVVDGIKKIGRPPDTVMMRRPIHLHQSDIDVRAGGDTREPPHSVLLARCPNIASGKAEHPRIRGKPTLPIINTTLKESNRIDQPRINKTCLPRCLRPNRSSQV